MMDGDVKSVSDDDDMLTVTGALLFFSGPDRPMNPSTFYRGIEKGPFPKPIHVGPNMSRWLRSECAEYKRRMVEARDTGTAPYRRRGKALKAKAPEPAP
jgi:hypothetical protein